MQEAAQQEPTCGLKQAPALEVNVKKPHDPKYRFGQDDTIWHRESEYYVDPDEPVMLLRGKDVTALHACIMYVEILLDMPPNETVDSHLKSSFERLRVFYEYQKHSGVAGVGCSQKHHGGSEKIIDRAEALLREHRLI